VTSDTLCVGKGTLLETITLSFGERAGARESSKVESRVVGDGSNGNGVPVPTTLLFISTLVVGVGWAREGGG
jgi:hypothetical protein